MRNLLAVFMLCAALPVMGADRPVNLQPIPDPPPPPPGFELDPALEPQVTIIKRGTDTVEEYRVGGRLYMLKVTPVSGRSYYLIDEKGDGKMSRQETFDFGLRPPMWVIRVCGHFCYRACSTAQARASSAISSQPFWAGSRWA